MTKAGVMVTVKSLHVLAAHTETESLGVWNVSYQLSQKMRKEK